MEKFIAINGCAVRVETESLVAGNMMLSPAATRAAREFFRHERDEELGRWRWPENPDYAVYPDGTNRVVVNEATGRMMDVSLHARKTMTTYLDSYVGAARAYDAAHPAPRPWHDAKPGEVWVLTTNNGKTHGGVIDANRNLHSIDSDGNELQIAIGDSWITAGRRIFPEVSSD